MVKVISLTLTKSAASLAQQRPSFYPRITLFKTCVEPCFIFISLLWGVWDFFYRPVGAINVTVGSQNMDALPCRLILAVSILEPPFKCCWRSFSNAEERSLEIFQISKGKLRITVAWVGVSLKHLSVYHAAVSLQCSGHLGPFLHGMRMNKSDVMWTSTHTCEFMQLCPVITGCFTTIRDLVPCIAVNEWCFSYVLKTGTCYRLCNWILIPNVCSAAMLVLRHNRCNVQYQQPKHIFLLQAYTPHIPGRMQVKAAS